MLNRFLVTGATGEIGTVVSKYLASKGCNLLLTARKENKLQLLTTQIKTEHPGIDVDFSCSDFENPSTFVDLVEKAKVGIQGALIMPPQFPPTSNCLPRPEEWEQMFRGSFIGPVELIRQLIPVYQRAEEGGRVVLISGITSLQPIGHYSTSSVLRTMWTGQMKILADTYGSEGIRFNTLSLGGVMTPKQYERIDHEASNSGLPFHEVLMKRFNNVPLKKYAELNEIADTVHFMLTSTGANHMTGINIPYDGGFARRY